jgi:hypothetical protein
MRSIQFVVSKAVLVPRAKFCVYFQGHHTCEVLLSLYIFLNEFWLYEAVVLSMKYADLFKGWIKNIMLHDLSCMHISSS